MWSVWARVWGIRMADFGIKKPQRERGAKAKSKKDTESAKKTERTLETAMEGFSVKEVATVFLPFKTFVYSASLR